MFHHPELSNVMVAYCDTHLIWAATVHPVLVMAVKASGTSESKGNSTNVSLIKWSGIIVYVYSVTKVEDFQNTLT